MIKLGNCVWWQTYIALSSTTDKLSSDNPTLGLYTTITLPKTKNSILSVLTSRLSLLTLSLPCQVEHSACWRTWRSSQMLNTSSSQLAMANKSLTSSTSPYTSFSPHSLSLSTLLALLLVASASPSSSPSSLTFLFSWVSSDNHCFFIFLMISTKIWELGGCFWWCLAFC